MIRNTGKRIRKPVDLTGETELKIQPVNFQYYNNDGFLVGATRLEMRFSAYCFVNNSKKKTLRTHRTGR